MQLGPEVNPVGEDDWSLCDKLPKTIDVGAHKFVDNLVDLAVEYGKHMEGDYFEITDFVKWVSNRLNVPIDLDKLNS